MGVSIRKEYVDGDYGIPYKVRKIYTGEVRVVVARKDHVCSEHSYHKICKGDRYLLMAMAPWHEMNDGKKWVRCTVCLRCADEYGMHTNETRKQLEMS